MSDTTDDLEAARAKVRRDIAEAWKLGAEREKLFAETLKLYRDRSLAPVIAIGGLLVGTLGVIAGILGLILHAK